MGRYVNLDEKVTAEFYDEEHEERFVKEGTVEDILSICDSYTEVDAEPVIRCKDCKYKHDSRKCPSKFFGAHSEDDYCSWAVRRTE